MKRSKILFLILLLFTLTVSSIVSAQDTEKKADINELIIRKTVKILPDEYKSILMPFINDIIKGSKVSEDELKKNPDPYYFINKNIGNAPRAIYDQYKLTFNNIKNKKNDSIIAGSLGKLARYIIAINQPYHTDQDGYTSSEHAEFEKNLTDAAEKIETKYDGFNKITTPTKYAVELASKGNKLFSNIGKSEPNDIYKAFVNNSANSVADIWMTLLSPSKPQVVVLPNANAGFYIGNKNSMKYHLPTCRFLPSQKNRVSLASKQEAASKGYSPCKICKP